MRCGGGGCELDGDGDGEGNSVRGMSLGYLKLSGGG